MLIGLIGLPNAGKSTFFNAATSGNAVIASYPFTTVDPNKGVAFVTEKCPHPELGLRECNPRSGSCLKGVRKIPVNIVDVAGLVEGAHEGKGRGNAFLNDLSNADALILVVDASGKTDNEGNVAEKGEPVAQARIVLNELDEWLAQVIQRNAQKAKMKKLEEFALLLSGLKIKASELREAVTETGIGEEQWKWDDEQCLALATSLREKTKPLLIAANKSDSKEAEQNILLLKEEFPEMKVIAASADSELALQKAKQHGLIEYDGKSMKINENVPEKLKQALEKIQENVLRKNGTGVQECLNETVFNLLQKIVVYPVEDEKHCSDHKGNALPDAVLLTKGSTAVQLAECIHTDLAKGFLYAIDVRKQMRIAKEHPLGDGDVVKVVSAR